MAVLLGLLLALPSYAYVYICGMRDGVARYRQSRQFAMTLDSMYRFGVMDGCLDEDTCDLMGLGDASDDGGHR